ncbi:MAG: hypothetical protein V1789_01925 [PVC group bacterium]
MEAVKMEKIAYGGWENCLRLSNGQADLVVTTAVGPRVIRYGFAGKENEFCEVAADRGKSGGEEWRMYGGHRLWHGPEDRERTYQPDNREIAWREIPGGVSLQQPVESGTGIMKELDVRLFPGGSRVELLHRLTNRGLRPAELSAWAITVMAPGGWEVIPQPEKADGLLPNRLIALWPYSRLNDPRVAWGGRYIVLRQGPSAEGPCKLGVPNERGWAAYFNRGRLFLKRYTHFPAARYPDFGVSYETYTNDFMLEMETLSPLSLLAPGGSIEHREEWELFDNISCPGDDEKKIEAALDAVGIL